jgi:predicted dehydrogenase
MTKPGGQTTQLEPAPSALDEVLIWEAFASAAREGTPPPVTMDSVLVTMRLLDAARESSAAGRAVDV